MQHLTAKSIFRVIFLIVLLAILLVFPNMFDDPFGLRTMTLVLMWSVLGLSWNLIGGYAGQVSLGHAIFFGLGAYTSTVLLTRWGISPWLGMLAGALVAAIAGFIIGWPTFRLAGHYFAIATIAAGEIFLILFTNWRFAGDARGLSLPIIRGDRLINFQFHENRASYYYVMLVMLILAGLVTFLIERSRFGYYLKAIREDPDAARSLGISLRRYKLMAMVISAAMTAMVGSFYAQFVLYISPNGVFPLLFSIQMVLVAALGGTGTLAGPIIGAVVLIPMAEYTRVFLGGTFSIILQPKLFGQSLFAISLEDVTVGGLHLVVYGLLIMLIAIYQPGGLMIPIRNLERRIFRQEA